LPITFDNILDQGKAKILAYKKNENHNLLAEIKGNFPREYGKLFHNLRRFNEFGELKDEEKFKHISGNTYEFKVNKLRVFCVMLDGAIPITIVLNHYYKKQKQRMPHNERDKAFRLSEEITRLFKEGKLIIEE